MALPLDVLNERALRQVMLGFQFIKPRMIHAESFLQIGAQVVVNRLRLPRFRRRKFLRLGCGSINDPPAAAASVV